MKETLNASETISMRGSIETVVGYRFLYTGGPHIATAGQTFPVIIEAYDNNNQLVPTTDIDGTFALTGPAEAPNLSASKTISQTSSFGSTGSATFEITFYAAEHLGENAIQISSGSGATLRSGRNRDEVIVGPTTVDYYTIRAQDTNNASNEYDEVTRDASSKTTGIFDVLVKAYDKYGNPTSSESNLSLAIASSDNGLNNSTAFGVLTDSGNNDPYDFSFTSGSHLLEDVYFGVDQQIELSLSTSKTVVREGQALESGELPDLKFIHTFDSVNSYELTNPGDIIQPVGLVSLSVVAKDNSGNTVKNIDTTLSSHYFCWKGPSDSENFATPSFINTETFINGKTTFNLTLVAAESVRNVLNVYDSYNNSNCTDRSVIPSTSRHGQLIDDLTLTSSNTAVGFVIEKSLSGDAVAGQAFGINIRTVDSYGNTVTTDSRGISISVSGGNAPIGTSPSPALDIEGSIGSGTYSTSGTAINFFKAGDAKVTVTDTSGFGALPSIELDVTIKPAAKSFVKVHTDFGVTDYTNAFASNSDFAMSTNQSQSLFAKSYDQYGNYIGPEDVTWALASATGLTVPDLFGTYSATSAISLSPSLTGYAKIVAIPAVGITAFTSNNDVVVSLGTPTNIVISNTPASAIEAGGCLLVQIEFQNDDGIASAISHDIGLTLTDGNSSASGTFHNDSGCSGGGSYTRTLASGNSTFDIYFKAETIGNYTIEITDGSKSVSHPVEIISASASQLVFTTSPHSFTTTDTTCNKVAFVVHDQFNNPTQLGSSTPITMTPEPDGNLTFYNSSCTSEVSNIISTGNTYTGGNFYFKGDKSGVWDITLSGGGLSGSYTQAHTIKPGGFSASVGGNDEDVSPNISWATPSQGAKEYLVLVFPLGSSCLGNPYGDPLRSVSTTGSNVDVTPDLANGDYIVCTYAKGHDATGPYQLDSNSPMDLKVDTLSPVITFTSSAITSNSTADFEIKVTDHSGTSLINNSNGEGVTLTWSIQSTPGGSSTITYDNSLANPTFSTGNEGTWVVRLTAMDSYSNSSFTDFTFIYDNTKPNTPSNVRLGHDSSNPDEIIDFDPNVYLSWDPVGDATSYQVNFYKGANCDGTELDDRQTNNAYLGQTVYADGTYSFTVRAIDAAGNVSDPNDCSNGRISPADKNKIEVETSNYYFSFVQDTDSSVQALKLVGLEGTTTPLIKLVEMGVPGNLFGLQSNLQIDGSSNLHLGYSIQDVGSKYKFRYETDIFSGFFSSTPAFEDTAADDDLGKLNSIAIHSDNSFSAIFQDKNTDGMQWTYKFQSGGNNSSLYESNPNGKDLLDTAIASDNNDYVHIVYVEKIATESVYTLKYRQINNFPTIAQDVGNLPAECDDYGPVDIAINQSNGDNDVHLAYICVDNTGSQDDCKLYHTIYDGAWASHTAIATLDANCNRLNLTTQNKPKIAIDSNGHPNIAAVHPDSGKLRYYYHNSNNFVEDSSLTEHGGNTSIISGVAMALDEYDLPILVFQNESNHLYTANKNSGSWVFTAISGATSVLSIGDIAIEGIEGKSNH